MAKIETLTAYLCKFSYLQRNNPLLEKQRDAIRDGIEPEFTFSDFIEKYTEYTRDLAIGESTDRAIILEIENVSASEKNGVKRWHLIPLAGKQGKPVTVIKRSSGKKYDFGSDTAALYNYNAFVYDNGNNLIIIFHRQNGSGCKSVFLETANKVLKNDGLKLHMELIMPMVDAIKNAPISKIFLQYTKDNKSTDIAENLSNTRKKRIIRELVINLDELENHKINKILKSFREGQIDRIQAFATIKGELAGTEDFNDAEVKIRIGNRYKKVQWSEIEHIMGVHDISEELYAAVAKSKDFIGELSRLSDQYYESIIQSGEI